MWHNLGGKCPTLNPSSQGYGVAGAQRSNAQLAGLKSCTQKHDSDVRRDMIIA